MRLPGHLAAAVAKGRLKTSPPAPRSLAPGSALSLVLPCTAPSVPGRYPTGTLEVDWEPLPLAVEDEGSTSEGVARTDTGGEGRGGGTVSLSLPPVSTVPVPLHVALACPSSVRVGQAFTLALHVRNTSAHVACVEVTAHWQGTCIADAVPATGVEPPPVGSPPARAGALSRPSASVSATADFASLRPVSVAYATQPNALAAPSPVGAGAGSVVRGTPLSPAPPPTGTTLSASASAAVTVATRQPAAPAPPPMSLVAGQARSVLQLLPGAFSTVEWTIVCNAPGVHALPCIAARYLQQQQQQQPTATASGGATVLALDGSAAASSVTGALASGLPLPLAVEDPLYAPTAPQWVPVEPPLLLAGGPGGGLTVVAES